MCGRYGISVTREELKEYLGEHYGIEVLDEQIRLPRYNIAPGQDAVSLIGDGTRFRVGLLKWGFVPEWAKDEKVGYKMINARKEGLSQKPAFKKSFLERRCVILADGFFEWYRTTSTKTPYYFYLKNNKIFGFAGLWSVMKRADGSKLYTCSIITTTANSLMSDIHDRMPVILTEDQAKLWLDPNQKDLEVLNELLGQYDPNDMQLHEVSSRVNKPLNDDPDIILPVDKTLE
ncbi:MAG: SOS response-associated peptidase [Bacilli bacterium]|nr:SOS response-associated peptidase [Bacilli bacterium]MBN2877142.1 SOS response-associated peptidase [Bacilli bacterium]